MNQDPTASLADLVLTDQLETKDCLELMVLKVRQAQKDPGEHKDHEDPKDQAENQVLKDSRDNPDQLVQEASKVHRDLLELIQMSLEMLETLDLMGHQELLVYQESPVTLGHLVAKE